MCCLRMPRRLETTAPRQWFRPHPNASGLMHTQKTDVAQAVATEAAIYQRLHALISLQIWRRTYKANSDLPSCLLISSMVSGGLAGFSWYCLSLYLSGVTWRPLTACPLGQFSTLLACSSVAGPRGAQSTGGSPFVWFLLAPWGHTLLVTCPRVEAASFDISVPRSRQSRHTRRQCRPPSILSTLLIRGPGHPGALPLLQFCLNARLFHLWCARLRSSCRTSTRPLVWPESST